jgi:hypothetical protein
MKGTLAWLRWTLLVLAAAAATVALVTPQALAGQTAVAVPRLKLQQQQIDPQLRACLQRTREHLATAATRNLSAGEKIRLQAVVSLLRGGKQDAAMADWGTLMQSVVSHGSSVPVDINSLILYVMREAYLEPNADLRGMAEKISAQNEARAALRRHLQELRDAEAGQPGGAAFVPMTVKEPVVGPTPPVTYRKRTLQTRAELQACAGDVEKALAEMEMSFNLQYLMLQNKISHENRQFSMISNTMQNKHDTARNSINNVR